MDDQTESNGDESDSNERDSEINENDDESDHFVTIVDQNLNGQQDDSQPKHRKLEESEIERLAQIKREQEKRKGEFKDKMVDFVGDEQERDKLYKNFEDKMRQLDNMLKNDSNN